MKKEYLRPETLVLLLAEDTVRTSPGSDEGRGFGVDYFADDDFNLYTY